ncbi:uncharacterized protein LOC120169740 [Hibiscus syriacus]|uniref:uncharacterized protein LOC120169740 n=1 Tax=Hibiscus syriacus TaxID=106335 RepID=UPI001922932E|nr:uncharacterized protein LOC120169740 [Hibiscus syriacus]
MADYAVDSGSHVGSKRRTSTDTDQQEENLLQLPSSLSETTVDRRDSTPPDRQDETAIDNSSPKKKAKCFPLLSEGNQEMGLHSFTQKNVSLSEPFEKEEAYDVETKEGSFGIQQVGSQVNAIEAGLGFEEKRVIKGKDLESETVLEAEKKRLLDELEVGNIFGGTKGLALPVKGSLMVEVIDDTALIGSFPLSRTGNGSGKDEKQKGEHEIDCTRTKRSRRKRKNVKEVLGESGTVRHVESTEIFEIQNGKKESGNQNKIMYSRKELEALRFANGVGQRNFWRDVYKSLGKDVIREYETWEGGSIRRKSAQVRAPIHVMTLQRRLGLLQL